MTPRHCRIFSTELFGHKSYLCEDMNWWSPNISDAGIFQEGFAIDLCSDPDLDHMEIELLGEDEEMQIINAPRLFEVK